jgi:acetylglutamate kinase
MSRVDAGMLPKLEACVRAVSGGVPQAHVIDGRQPHSLLLEVFTSEGIGTMIVPDAEADPSLGLTAQDEQGDA